MENLNIEQFSPKKAELIALADSYKNLDIKGVDDKDGYAAVDAARKELKRHRVHVTKQGKALRQEALQFQKKVISLEKELIAIIDPVESMMIDKQEKIDQLILAKAREEQLPYRREKLASIGVSVEDSLLVVLNDLAFMEFFNQKHTEKIAEEQAKIESERAALAKESARLEEEKRIELARQEAAAAAAKQAKLDAEVAAAQAELDKKKAVEEAERKAQAEKQAIIDAQAAKEAERVQAEKKKAEDDAAEKAKMEKKKAYVAFLTKNGCTQQGLLDGKFKVEFESSNSVKLYQLIDQINL